MLPSHETVPLRHVPFSGYRTHLHVPYFAMGRMAIRSQASPAGRRERNSFQRARVAAR